MMIDKQKLRSAFILVDIEGIAGIHDKQQCKPNSPPWQAARQLITADVNATINGLRAAGVTEIIVRDMHGTGYNIYPAGLVTGVPCIQGQYWQPVPLIGAIPRVDCALMIGWHAGPDQSEGFSPHIFHRYIRALKINGSPITEVELFAAVLGEYGLPVVFLTADAIAIERIEKSLPWLRSLEIPKHDLTREELADIHQRMEYSIMQCLGETNAKPLIFGHHTVEMTTSHATSTWQSSTAIETLTTVLHKTVFKGVPAALIPAMLFLYRTWGRFRMDAK